MRSKQRIEQKHVSGRKTGKFEFSTGLEDVFLKTETKNLELQGCCRWVLKPGHDPG